MTYRLMRVRVREQMFEDLEEHAMERSAEADRRIYVSDIVRFALRESLATASVRDPSGGAGVVAAQSVQAPVMAESECGLQS